jgi:hypothetical protein
MSETLGSQIAAHCPATSTSSTAATNPHTSVLSPPQPTHERLEESEVRVFDLGKRSRPRARSSTRPASNHELLSQHNRQAR